MNLRKVLFSVTLLVFGVCVVSNEAMAHKVSVFAWVEGNTVYVESKFLGGKRPKGAKVTVTDDAGNTVNEGITDDQGFYQFKIPAKKDLKIILYAGAGHQGEWLITKDELGAVAPVAIESYVMVEDRALVSKPASVIKRDDTGCLSPQEIENLIQRAIHETLGKDRESIGRIRAMVENQGPDFRDILGGIGYILGLVGLGAYIASRKRNITLSHPETSGMEDDHPNTPR